VALIFVKASAVVKITWIKYGFFFTFTLFSSLAPSKKMPTGNYDTVTAVYTCTPLATLLDPWNI